MEEGETIYGRNYSLSSCLHFRGQRRSKRDGIVKDVKRKSEMRNISGILPFLHANTPVKIHKN